MMCLLGFKFPGTVLGAISLNACFFFFKRGKKTPAGLEDENELSPTSTNTLQTASTLLCSGKTDRGTGDLTSPKQSIAQAQEEAAGLVLGMVPLPEFSSLPLLDRGLPPLTEWVTVAQP